MEENGWTRGLPSNNIWRALIPELCCMTDRTCSKIWTHVNTCLHTWIMLYDIACLTCTLSLSYCKIHTYDHTRDLLFCHLLSVVSPLLTPPQVLIQDMLLAVTNSPLHSLREQRAPWLWTGTPRNSYTRRPSRWWIAPAAPGTAADCRTSSSIASYTGVLGYGGEHWRCGREPIGLRIKQKVMRIE